MMDLRRSITVLLVGSLLGACSAAAPTGQPSLVPSTSSTAPTAAATAASSPTPRPTLVVMPTPAAAGRILFQSAGRDPKHNIFAMDPDGSHVVALPNGTHDYSPVWSPDHHQIAFVRSDTATKPGIYVMNADGSNVRRVAYDPAWYSEFPAWSPDGTQLAFVASKGSGGLVSARLDVVKVDGTGRHTITDSLAGSARVAWSPDGAWILFGRASDCDLCAIHPDGSGMHPVAAMTDGSTAGFGFASWSGDGRKIAFQRDHSIVVVNADGSGAVPLTSGAADDEFVDWSPDGNWLVFTRFADGANSQLWIMRADGSDPTMLTLNRAFSDTFPSWR